MDNPYLMEGGFDCRLKTPFRYIVTGPSMAGKTTHVYNVIKERQQLFDVPTDNVIYFYNQWQDIYNAFNSDGLVKQWINHLPTEEDIVTHCGPFKEMGGSIIVIDDFMLHLNKYIADLFTTISHHLHINIFLLTQNLFVQTPIYRSISLSTTYIACFKNPRDVSQIGNLAKQMAQGNTRYVLDAYNEATKAPHSYLLFDYHQTTDARIKLRSNILQKEFPTRVWPPPGTSI
jgi:hypothetical protein